MATLPPVYKEQGRIYTIDTCHPQVSAMQAGQIRMEALSHGYYPGRRVDPALLPGVPSLGFWDAVGRQEWGLEWHRNEGLEITFLETGEMPALIVDRKLSLRPDDLTLTRPWQAHRLGDPFIAAGRLHWVILDVQVRRPNQPWRWPHWIILTEPDLRELTEMLRESDHPHWHGTPEIRQCFRHLAALVRAEDLAAAVSAIKVHMNMLLLEILAMLRGRTFKRDPALTGPLHTVRLFLDDLARNASAVGAEWTLETMAAECGMKKSSFINFCRTLTNTTPMEYLRNCRLDLAARLLRGEPAASVTDIAFRCGFNSSQYFATCFRRRFHCPPLAYRHPSFPSTVSSL